MTRALVDFPAATAAWSTSFRANPLRARVCAGVGPLRVAGFTSPRPWRSADAEKAPTPLVEQVTEQRSLRTLATVDQLTEPTEPRLARSDGTVRRDHGPRTGEPGQEKPPSIVVAPPRCARRARRDEGQDQLPATVSQEEACPMAGHDPSNIRSAPIGRL